MSKMIDLYDFDHTIYRGDSTVDFYRFSVRQKPSLLRYLPHQGLHYLLYILRLEDQANFKANFFRFLRGIDDVGAVVEAFWNTHQRKLKNWYMDHDHTRDVIISASPGFLLRPITAKLKVDRLISTEIDTATGKLIGPNCYGQEKVKRLREELPGVVIEKAYSDHLSDKPMLDLAKEAYIVIGEKVIQIPD